MNNEAPICPICEKRRREKGRVKLDGTIWYRPVCRMCRSMNRKTDEQMNDKDMMREIKELRRYKRALTKLCDIKCIDIEDVLKKFADRD